jgi:hypothetical protein
MRRQLRQLARIVGEAAVLLGTLTVISSTVIGAPARMVDRASAATAADPASTTGADCSKSTATQLVNQLRMNNFELSDPVQQVLCGSFTGAGSEAMAVAIGAATCWGVQRWAVFRSAGSGWQLVLDQPEWIFLPLVALGGDIQVTSPVFRPGDPRCLPSGGKQARVWHWDGSKFVAGPYKQVSPGDVKSRYFYSPSRNIFCGMGDSNQFRGANCSTFKPVRTAELSASGRVQIIRCHGSSCKDCGCREQAPILPYAQQITVGRFQCVSLKTGMNCTVSKTGKGFLISRSGIKRIG